MNGNGQGTYSVDLYAEMRAFDRMPRVVRDAFNYAQNCYSALQLTQLGKDYALPPEGMAAMIQTADIAEAENAVS